MGEADDQEREGDFTSKEVFEEEVRWDAEFEGQGRLKDRSL